MHFATKKFSDQSLLLKDRKEYNLKRSVLSFLFAQKSAFYMEEIKNRPSCSF
jgi:hypothetical protein